MLEGHKVLGTYPRIDGKIGATHVCTPNFADEGTRAYGLPSHGPVRAMPWAMCANDGRMLEIRLVTDPLPAYPAPLEVTQRFEFAQSSAHDVFLHTVSVKNVGHVEVPVNIAIHNYFNTPHGWKGTRMNERDITEEISTDKYFEAQRENVIAFPGAPEILLATENVAHFMVWTGRKDEVYDSAYACIEPVYQLDPTYFGSPESMLQPGEERTISQRIALE